MQLTVTAEWTTVGPLIGTENAVGDRLAIAGYTAVVQAVEKKGVEVFEFTVLRDHIEIVAVGHRVTREGARQAVERIITSDLAGLSA